MGFYNWTLRQKAKVAMPVVIAATFALSNLACADTTSVTLANNSETLVFFQDSITPCEELDVTALKASYWSAIQPGTEETFATFRRGRCLAIQTRGGTAHATTEFHENSRYTVTVSGNEVRIATIVGEPKGDNSRFAIVSAIAGVPFLLGMLAAILITLRFFYRYYSRHDKTAQLQ